MCELLGMCFNQEVQPSFSLRGFRMRSERNPHGWGLAFYPDKSVQVYKEPVKSRKSLMAEIMEGYNLIRSSIIMSHVRYTSKGSVAQRNTHPFQREWDGREYVFAHNGTLNAEFNLEDGRYRPVGETDSEMVFCHIMNQISENGVTFEDESEYRWLWDLLRDINQRGTFNCLLSDGRHLFCYHDHAGYNGLCQLHRRAPYDKVKLLDDDYEINLAHEKRPDQEGYIIASNPLTNEKWEEFQEGELRVYRDGKLVYISGE